MSTILYAVSSKTIFIFCTFFPIYFHKNSESEQSQPELIENQMNIFRYGLRCQQQILRKISVLKPLKYSQLWISFPEKVKKWESEK